jgi:hypothetical protein
VLVEKIIVLNCLQCLKIYYETEKNLENTLTSAEHSTIAEEMDRPTRQPGNSNLPTSHHCWCASTSTGWPSTVGPCNYIMLIPGAAEEIETETVQRLVEASSTADPQLLRQPPGIRSARRPFFASEQRRACRRRTRSR